MKRWSILDCCNKLVKYKSLEEGEQTRDLTTPCILLAEERDLAGRSLYHTDFVISLQRAGRQSY